MIYNGVDVSALSGLVDWQEAANSGIEFAMLRASFGKFGIDSHFKYNINNIKKTNIPAGAYHYAYAQTPLEAIEEAKNFINVISPYELNYPIAVAIEEHSISLLGKDEITKIIKTFTDFFKSHGYYPIVFINEEWLEKFIDHQKLNDVDFWVSTWNAAPYSKDKIGIRREYNNVTVPGIGENVNVDTSYKDYKSIINSNVKNNEKNINKNLNTKNKTNETKSDDCLKSSPCSLNSEESKTSNAYNPSQNNNNDRINNSSNNYQNNRQEITKNYNNQNVNKLNSSNNYQNNRQETTNNYNNQNANKLNSNNNYQNNRQEITNNYNSNKLNSNDGYNKNNEHSQNNSCKLNSSVEYRVKPGDTLWSIADKFYNDGHKYRQILFHNKLSSDVISPGQIIKIPQDLSNDFWLYNVKRQDTLFNIGEKMLGNGERYKEIQKLNNLINDKIYPGQILKIPRNKIKDESSNSSLYTVRLNDTLTEIALRLFGNANKYKDIMRANNLKSTIIKPGQQLIIPKV